MTMPVMLEPSVRVSWRRRLVARFAVAAAWPLIRLSPRRLRSVLRVLRRGARPSTAEQVLAARDAVVSVSVRCAGQGCLQRSVAVVLLARLGGRWADWCTGVCIEPFRAHAWVEVDGTPIGERNDIKAYRTVMSVPLR
ncbi:MULTISPECIES: lasso peptide biosynthesis B2 protein [Actinoalloteichus]|uniref:Cys protease B2 n=1 Tax=Actinoalloteichus fjordicus TaxID=1612552 RepID=A0A1V0D994_9PSEU|nr:MULTISPECIES: lasso peptide biosynthesis B2 protein [Actinoalloteichus]APU13608.1 Transglutaminase-like superfamily [Actinoalloteichus fjordicus]APU19555.1 Transglutaminase-like superfamily [Actinoalloteichus sp. GBA129-24]ARA91555.1 Cys protease B2 [Actinoalloteichus fjordicus]